MHRFVEEFFTNFVHKFKYEIHMNSREYTNSYEFFARKIGCYEWPVLYTNTTIFHRSQVDNIFTYFISSVNVSETTNLLWFIRLS